LAKGYRMIATHEKQFFPQKMEGLNDKVQASFMH